MYCFQAITAIFFTWTDTGLQCINSPSCQHRAQNHASTDSLYLLLAVETTCVYTWGSPKVDIAAASHPALTISVHTRETNLGKTCCGSSIFYWVTVEATTHCQIHLLQSAVYWINFTDFGQLVSMITVPSPLGLVLGCSVCNPQLANRAQSCID